MKWLDDIRARFDDRDELPPPALAAEFGVGEERMDALNRCLAVFHEEYGIVPGRLRPGDSLEPFTDEPRASILEWLWVRFAYEEGLGELRYALACARRRMGVPEYAGELNTVGEYVRAWLGETAEARAS